MPRAKAMAPPDAIRIEDEVWQEAFTRREPGRTRTRRRLQSADRDRTSSTLEPHATVTEPAEVPDRLAATADSAPASGAGSVGDAFASGSLGDSSSGDSPIPALPRPAASSAAPIRRTVTIRGRGAEGHLPWPDASPTRSNRRAYERAGFRPDRLAMWAVLLGFLLVVVAILSAH
jgi:hypothetical protein